MRFGRAQRPALDVGPGERLLAWAEAGDGRLIGGTRDALYLASAEVEERALRASRDRSEREFRIPWEQVAAAEWDAEQSLLRVVEVGGGEHRVPLDDPRRLLQLVRERVTASVVLQRRVTVHGKQGFRVVARRPPGRVEAGLSWVLEYDPGIDQDDPGVRRLVAAELAAARSDVGDR